MDRNLIAHIAQYATTDVRRHVELASAGLFGHERYYVDRFLRPDRATLEIGTGAGRIAFALAKRGFCSIVAVDVVPALIQEAIQLASAHDFKGRFEVGDISALSFDDQSFEQIVCFGVVLSHILGRQARLKALREMFRVLKPGGLLVIDSLNVGFGWHVPVLKFFAWLTGNGVNDFPRVGQSGRFDPLFFRPSKPRLHYFRQDELMVDVMTAGFAVLEVNCCARPAFADGEISLDFTREGSLHLAALRQD